MVDANHEKYFYSKNFQICGIDYILIGGAQH